MIDATKLKRLFSYNPETGYFTRLEKTWPGSRVGERITNASSAGYIQVFIARKPHKAHRLAFLYMTGAWPIGEVDHIDGNHANNAWGNLRDVTPSMNQQNRRSASKNSTHGFMGVTRNSSGKPWRAQIKMPGGKRTYLGSFMTPEEAHAAYIEAKSKHHPGMTEVKSK